MHVHKPSEYINVDFRYLTKTCPTCFQVFASTLDRDYHQHRERHHGSFTEACYYCHRRFITQEELLLHVNESHFAHYVLKRSAFNGRLQELSRTFAFETIADVASLDNSERAILTEMLSGYLNRWNSLSFNLSVFPRYAKYRVDGRFEGYFTLPITTTQFKLIANMPHLVLRGLDQHFRQADRAVEAAQTCGSGFVLVDVVGITLRLARATFSAAGGCSSDAAALAMENLTFRKRRAILDVPSHWLHGCLWTSISQAYFDTRSSMDDVDASANVDVTYDRTHPRYLQTKAFAEKFLQRGQFKDRRVFLEELHLVEELNKNGLDFALNVYVMGSRKEFRETALPSTDRRGGSGPKSKTIFFPGYISQRSKKAKKVITLLLCGDLFKPEEMHYVYVQDPAFLLLNHSQYHRYDCCPYCLNTVLRCSLEEHMKTCLNGSEQRIVMPKMNEDGSAPRLEFCAAKKRFLATVVGYADFECGNSYRRTTGQEADVGEDVGDAVEDFASDASGSNEKDEEDDWLPEKVKVLEGQELLDFMASGNTYTRVTALQQPISYSLAFVGGSPKSVIGSRSYSSTPDELLADFVSSLGEAYNNVEKVLNDMAHVKPTLSLQQREEYLNAVTCWICNKEFSDDLPGMDKVLDHAHSSLDPMTYIGAAHRKCNSARQYSKQIPIFVHNLDK